MNIKTKLKKYLREIRLDQNDLYYRTGYHFEDVKTEEDFQEIKRILEII